MSAAGPANYRVFKILKRLKKNGFRERHEEVGNIKEVDVFGKVVGLNYYESLYSPMVTASFLQQDVGGTVGDQKDDFAGTLKDGLPIEGFEEVLLKVQTTYGSVDWRGKKRRFVITGSPFNIDKGNRQSAYFPMVSINAIKSSSKPVKRIYDQAKISDIVKKILKEAGLPFKNRNIEETENSMKIDGNNENPLDTILKLCPKSVPVNGDPGYFFFENSEGFNFKSIHGMISEGVRRFSDRSEQGSALGYGQKHTYVYKIGLTASLDKNTNDFNVLAPPTVRRDQDQLNAIKMGQYNVRICSRNIVTGEVNEKIVNVYNNSTDKKTVTLGNINEDDVNNDQTSESDKSQNYCRTYSYVIAGGEDSVGVTTSISNNPVDYHPKAIMRYGLIHAQLVNIIVPHNSELTVGEVIRLNIENITQDNKIEKEFNEHRSGYYLILHLCHSFTTDNSFTSLTLARDEYGIARRL